MNNSMDFYIYNDTAFILTYGTGIWCRPISEMLPPATVREFVGDAAGLSVGSARPNPGNVVVTLPYTTAHAGLVKSVVYDLLQREVRVLPDAAVGAGRHELPIDVSGLAAGTYYCAITADGRTEMRRFVVMH
jgi:hypothetical protein